jgi:hypothetical protein
MIVLRPNNCVPQSDRCFCNGPLCQAAPVYPVAGSLLLSVVSVSCHIIRSEEPVSPCFERSL